jgi:hypothetical protein
MNDPTAPSLVQWFFRIAAVLSMKLVFPAVESSAGKHNSSDIDRRLVSRTPGK